MNLGQTFGVSGDLPRSPRGLRVLNGVSGYLTESPRGLGVLNGGLRYLPSSPGTSVFQMNSNVSIPYWKHSFTRLVSPQLLIDLKIRNKNYQIVIQYTTSFGRMKCLWSIVTWDIYCSIERRNIGYLICSMERRNMGYLICSMERRNMGYLFYGAS
jgi:hypothetical protein